MLENAPCSTKTASLKSANDNRPDSPFVVFYGESSEAQDAELKGKLVLTNSESMSVKCIRVTLTGMRKVSWYSNNTVRAGRLFPRTRLTATGHPAANYAKAKHLPRDDHALPCRRLEEQGTQDQRRTT
jgi:hypothetical protein